MVQPELYLTLRVQDGTVVPRVTCDVVVLTGAHLGLLVSIVATKSPDLTFVEDKGKKCFLGRHRCQHFDSLAVIVQTAHQFVAVATHQVITLVRGDEDLGEMGLERHSITSHRPPPELSIRVASLRLLLVVLHHLPCPFLPKFFQIDRIDIHIGDTAAARFKPRGIVAHVYEEVVLGGVGPEKFSLGEIVVLDISFILLVIEVLMPLHLVRTRLGKVRR